MRKYNNAWPSFSICIMTASQNRSFSVHMVKMWGQRGWIFAISLERSHAEAEHRCFTAKDASVKQQVETDWLLKERTRREPTTKTHLMRRRGHFSLLMPSEWVGPDNGKIGVYYRDVFAISSFAVSLWISWFLAHSCNQILLRPHTVCKIKASALKTVCEERCCLYLCLDRVVLMQ